MMPMRAIPYPFLQTRLTRASPHINQMGKPLNKGMSTLLSIPSLLAVTILMKLTEGKRNNSMMVTHRPPRQKYPFSHPSPCPMPPLMVTAPASAICRPRNSQTMAVRMLPPRHQPEQCPAMPYNYAKDLGQPEGSLNTPVRDKIKTKRVA